MEKADVVFFRSTDNLISKAISALTSSEYTHVGLVTSVSEDGKHGEIIEADRFIKTRRRAFEFDENLHALFRVPDLTERQRNDIVDYAISKEGTSYDYLQIIGFFLRLTLKLNISNLFNRANHMICSELIDISYYASGVERDSINTLGDVLPVELLDSYNFHLVNAEVTQVQQNVTGL